MGDLLESKDLNDLKESNKDSKDNSIEESNFAVPLLPKEKNADRKYLDSDRVAAKQLYFRLDIDNPENKIKEVSRMLNFPIKTVRKWEKEEGWSIEVEKQKSEITNNIKTLRNQHTVIKDNMLLIAAYQKKLKDYAEGKEKLSGTDLKTITELLEKQNQGVLGEDIKSAGQIVILMDKKAYEKER
jgi:hypothetical protein